MVHSRQLFHRRLFNSEENCPSYLKEVSEQILKKCAGLPLAIIAVSGLLANTEESEHLWNQVKDSIGRALERNASVELMMKILSLSYYDLPAHLKTCLLYLSMYPEDSIIGKKQLIRRWIAEGFIHKEGRYTTHELGERYLNDLLNRSLIQPEKTNRYGKLKGFRVHDTVLDFIISKSIEENFVTSVDVSNLTVGTQGKVRRLSLQNQDRKERNSIVPTGLILSHVRSISVSGPLEIHSLDEFRHLCVLHFETGVRLENHRFASIGRLLQLRYLNLRWISTLSELPEQIGDLGCLEMLDLRCTGIHKLPATFVNLSKLVDLLVDNDVKFPDGIAEMQSLEVLTRVGVYKQSLNFLLELGQLKNMRQLVLSFEYHYACTMEVEECKKVIFTSLHNLGTQNLCSLKIISGAIFLEDPSFPTLLGLLKIKTKFSTVPRVPTWLGSLLNLQELCLEVDEVGHEDLCMFGGLRALLVLDLQEVQETSGDKRLIVSAGAGFRCLRQFLYHTYNGTDMVFAAGSMPRLEKLHIRIFGVGADSLDFGIVNLPCLSIVNCILSGDDGIVKAVKTATERAVGTHPNHPTLLFEQWEVTTEI